MSRLIIAWLAATLLLTAGCGSGDGEKPAGDPAFQTYTADPAEEPADAPEEAETPPAPPDPQTLVTKREAEKVAGAALGDASATPESCTWTGPTSGPLAQFEIYVGPGAKKFLDIDRQLDHEFTDLPDIGDEAVIEDGTVFLRVDQTWVALRVTRLDDMSVYRDDLVDLAATVAERI